MRTDQVWRRLFVTGWLVSAGVTGLAVRQWQGRLREAEARAEEAERTREEAARRRAMEERLRIARDLHDSLTHSISVITLQAAVAIHLAEKRGEEVPAALEAIREASTEATRELRRTLSVLRDNEDFAKDDGLERLPVLIERAEGSGVAVKLVVTGQERPLPEAVSNTAYRLVQEALTNVRRHAGPVATTITLDYRPASLVVRVEDEGPRLRRPWAPGHGLTGMRERVEALGGELHTGPRPEGGFTVHAELPLPVSADLDDLADRAGQAQP
ncbi:MAG: hypothetical protein IRZ08_20250 [Frankia sp.]|nr:hypothetical protein [Frankia sp.]